MTKTIKAWLVLCVVLAVVVFSCFVPPSQSLTSVEVHEKCMMTLLERQQGKTYADEMFVKLNGIIGPRVSVDTLAQILLESYHVACFRYAGVPDHRQEMNDMPWVKPRMPLCLEGEQALHEPLPRWSDEKNLSSSVAF